MNKLKVLSSALLFCLTGLTAYCQGSPLKIEITTAKSAVKNDEEFSVNTVIRNTGRNDQVLAILDCCYSMLWVADNPSVYVDCGEACMNNSLYEMKLKPGDSYEKTVLVHVEPLIGDAPYQQATFRLGFRNDTEGTQSPNPLRIWSNAVTVNVTNDGKSGGGSASAKNIRPADTRRGTGGITITHVCETTSYNPKPPGVPPSRLTLLEGNRVSTTSSVLAYNASSHTYDGMLTIKNVGSGKIVGPFRIVFDSLTSGVTLTNSTSTFSCWPSVTALDVDSLEPGRSASVNLRFSNPKNETIKYVPLVYSGSFN
jgi:hypothetical protein